MMSNSLRFTGIPFIETTPRGAHVCAFYSSSQDLMELSVPYFTSGLLQHEFCVWIPSKDLSVRKAVEAIRKALPAGDRHRLEGQLEIISQEDWYFNNGRLDTVGSLKGCLKKLSQGLEQGYKGVRLSGVPPWERSERRNFLEYEKKVDSMVAQKQALVMCAYPIRQYKLDEFMEMIRHHGSVLVKSKGKWQHIMLSQRTTPVPSSKEYETLTARERQVMRLVTEGLTNVEIASTLTISPRTVEAHRAHLMRKLRLRNQVDLVRFALGSAITPTD